MTTERPGSESRDDANWANVGPRLNVDQDARGGSARMVDGKLLTGPIQGFGKMWQKTYRVPLAGQAGQGGPGAVIATWKEHFPEFWPAGNRFYTPITGIAPGEIALLDISLGPGAGLSTGVLVLYADAESFTLMTPEGHVFSGWITFSSFVESDATIAQAQVLMRAADPIYELGLMVGGHRREDDFWAHTLTKLAESLGASDPIVDRQVVCVDPHRQWSRAGNVWQNGAVRTGLFRVTAPVRWMARLSSRAFRR